MEKITDSSTEVAPIYNISHITDLFNIPEDALARMLDELKDTIPLLKKAYEISKELNPDQKPQDLIPVLKWQDDKKSYTDMGAMVDGKRESVRVNHKR